MKNFCEILAQFLAAGIMGTIGGALLVVLCDYAENCVRALAKRRACKVKVGRK